MLDDYRQEAEIYSREREMGLFSAERDVDAGIAPRQIILKSSWERVEADTKAREHLLAWADAYQRRYAKGGILTDSALLPESQVKEFRAGVKELGKKDPIGALLWEILKIDKRNKDAWAQRGQHSCVKLK